MRTRIHVNQHHIRANARDGGDRPVLTVKDSRQNRKGHRATIHGPSEIIYSPHKPLPCGARVWVETRASVTVDQGEPAPMGEPAPQEDPA